MYMMMADVNEMLSSGKKTNLKEATSSQALVNVSQNEAGPSSNINNVSDSAEASTNVDAQRHSPASNDEDDGGFKGWVFFHAKFRYRLDLFLSIISALIMNFFFRSELNKYVPAKNREENDEGVRRRQAGSRNRHSANRAVVEELEHRQEEEEDSY
jgi:hypothetical protein